MDIAVDLSKGREFSVGLILDTALGTAPQMPV
jgi:hypothetical protein